jgi:DNA-binding MarR family transcriptional regulator
MSAAARADQRTTLLHEALDAYRAFSQALHTTTASAWQRLDLSMFELKALMTIAQAEMLTVGGLAATLSVVRSEASRAADQLYRRGLITRVEDQVDRRRSLLGLTCSGHDLVDALLVGDQAPLAGSLTSLDPGDLQRLTQGLCALLAFPPGPPMLAPRSAAAQVGTAPDT